MSQAIVTTYHGPTNHSGARVTAKAWAGRVSVSYDHSLTGEQNHHAAAKALVDKLKWKGHWIEGGSPDQRSNFYVDASPFMTYPAGELVKSAFDPDAKS
jgi:hypothetical protein